MTSPGPWDTMRMPLDRPVGMLASQFYDTLLSRGMTWGMTSAEVRPLATEAEWASYETMCRAGTQYSRAMQGAGREWTSTRDRPWDDPLAVDERDFK